MHDDVAMPSVTRLSDNVTAAPPPHTHHPNTHARTLSKVQWKLLSAAPSSASGTSSSGFRTALTASGCTRVAEEQPIGVSTSPHMASPRTLFSARHPQEARHDPYHRAIAGNQAGPAARECQPNAAMVQPKEHQFGPSTPYALPYSIATMHIPAQETFCRLPSFRDSRVPHAWRQPQYHGCTERKWASLQH